MLTSHLVSSNAVYMSTDTLKSLTPEQQQVIHEAIFEAARYQDRLILDSEQDYLNKLKAEGMEVIEPDTAAFTENVKKHFFETWFTPEEKAFYEKIQKFQDF
jgi:TRAP-type C4-dicarboxylate transport system substrate-binding protein